ncbi:hypothetical protein Glove_103g70 [Diversispora epigaea]|uniref:Uncharacterized protein n=1 Tax=Diversispora epigaea TaxID=1348612 RepID=A0A397JE11_9GLOM|nr:hypothetical protein Glove_103g70 [Diversispora epigaea]
MSRLFAMPAQIIYRKLLCRSAIIISSNPIECAIQLLHYTPQDEINKGMFCLFANKSDPKELFAALHNLDEECLEKFIDLWDKRLVP